MFNQTYKQISGYIQRKDINETLKFSYSNFFTKFGVFILAMGFVFGLYPIGLFYFCAILGIINVH